jgi:hypothetical protein
VAIFETALLNETGDQLRSSEEKKAEKKILCHYPFTHISVLILFAVLI